MTKTLEQKKFRRGFREADTRFRQSAYYAKGTMYLMRNQHRLLQVVTEQLRTTQVGAIERATLLCQQAESRMLINHAGTDDE